MTKKTHAIRARLFYKSTCPPCNWMSKLATIMSLGTIKRVSILGDEADALYEKYPDHRGQLVLIEGKRVTFGRLVFAAVPRCIVMAWFNLIRSILK
jgi:hypothetical protein